VLVYGGISTDSYRVFTIFHVIQPIEEVSLSVDRLTIIVEVPGDFVARVRNLPGKVIIR
jgi:hypothetical protein